jgi:hypothetical protein
MSISFEFGFNIFIFNISVWKYGIEVAISSENIIGLKKMAGSFKNLDYLFFSLPAILFLEIYSISS